MFIVISLVAVFIIIRYVSKDAAVISAQKSNMILEIENYKQQADSLNNYLENYDNNIYSFYLTKILAIKTKCCVGELKFINNELQVIVYANSEKDFNRFKKKLNADFTLTEIEELGSVNVDNASMYKYCFHVSVS